MSATAEQIAAACWLLEGHANAGDTCALNAEYCRGDMAEAARHARAAAGHRAAADVLRDMARPAIRRAA